jgi:hypothetical protein
MNTHEEATNRPARHPQEDVSALIPFQAIQQARERLEFEIKNGCGHTSWD